MDQLQNALNFYSTTYNIFHFLGDFDISRDHKHLKNFAIPFLLGHFMETPTCYMVTNSSSIDHIITNMTSLFMKYCTVETGISDYY